MEKKKGVSKKIGFLCFCIFVFVIGIIVGAFYIYNRSSVNVEEKTVDGGSLSLTYADDSNSFVIENAIPTSDIIGEKLDSADMFFDFTINTELDEATSIQYNILLVRDEEKSNALNSNIKVYLEKENNGKYEKVVAPVIFTSNFNDKDLGKDVMKLYTNKAISDGSENYRLRLWLSDTAVYEPEEEQNFGIKISVQGTAK